MEAADTADGSLGAEPHVDEGAPVALSGDTPLGTAVLIVSAGDDDAVDGCAGLELALLLLLLLLVPAPVPGPFQWF